MTKGKAKKIEPYKDLSIDELNRLQKFLRRESSDNPELLKIQKEIENRVDSIMKK